MPPSDLPHLFSKWCKAFPGFRPGESIGREHPLWATKIAIEERLRSFEEVRARPNLKVDASAGKGRLTKDPWVCLRDTRVSDSTRRGFYVVFLFKRDMSGVYLTLNQGTTDLFEELGAVEARIRLSASSTSMRQRVADLTDLGFDLDDGIQLAPDGQGKKYEQSTVAHKLYSASNWPGEDAIRRDLTALLGAYDRLVADHLERAGAGGHAPDIAGASTEFAGALRDAGLTFGEAHDDFVRAFLASILTKSFVILTGLSGSGKTQIALRLGEWLDADATRVIPVRPDWTGPEALLGYENALADSIDDRVQWHAPTALRFMLRASNATSPHVLVLDEMNLAHVERYFADVLSGMESRRPCLPNVEEHAGAWSLVTDNPSVLLPQNLWIIGTVNVDETTYMFSPKVLDRANTLEFRVATSALPQSINDLRGLGRIAAASAGTAKALQAVVEDHDWHLEPDRQPDWLEQFAAALRTCHGLLTPHGFEFGHRVFQEAIRFAVIHHALGGGRDASHERALDLTVMQKMLPRLHGGRRRLEPVLRGLAQYAFEGRHTDDATFDPEVDADATTNAMLPLSFAKLQRMTRSLRANQFASFAE